MPSFELEWFKQALKEAKTPVIVFFHLNLNFWDVGQNNFEKHYCLEKAEEIVGPMEESGKVIASFSGHIHRGYRSMLGAKSSESHFLLLPLTYRIRLSGSSFLLDKYRAGTTKTFCKMYCIRRSFLKSKQVLWNRFAKLAVNNAKVSATSVAQ